VNTQAPAPADTPDILGLGAFCFGTSEIVDFCPAERFTLSNDCVSPDAAIT
jgi:hypothetical protein